MKKRLLALTAALCLLLSGCGAKLLERSYSSVSPHDASYRDGNRDTLRAGSYQDLVNAILLLLDQHEEDGVIRLYGVDSSAAVQMADAACREVATQTAPGAFLLDYVTYAGSNEPSSYKIDVRFHYRRSAEQHKAMISATSSDAIPELLRLAWRQDRPEAAIRVADFQTDAAGIEAMIRQTQAECETTQPWQVTFYPSRTEPGIVEVRFVPAEEEN